MRCPICGAEVIDAGDGTLVCRNGHVVSEAMPSEGVGAYVERESRWFYPPSPFSGVGTRESSVSVDTRYRAKAAYAAMLDALGVSTSSNVVFEGYSVVEKAVELVNDHTLAAAAGVYVVLATLGSPVSVAELARKLREAGWRVNEARLAKLLQRLNVRIGYTQMLYAYVRKLAAVVARKHGIDKDGLEALALRIAAAYARAVKIHRRAPSCVAAAAVYLAARILCCAVPYKTLMEETGRCDACIRLALRDILAHVRVEVGL